MAITTIYRIAEQVSNLIEGGDLGAASSIGLGELKVACGQVINKLLKTEHFSINEQMNEKIPNGSVLGLYTEIPIISYNGKSMSTLPIKPIKLPRNMGVWAIYFRNNVNENYDLDNESIPLQMGQGGLLKSQPMINNLLGQTAHECFGDQVIYNKDLPSISPNIQAAMRLVIMDISQYGDYDALPILPEMEMTVIQEVYKLYSMQLTAGKIVDATVKEDKGIPLKQQVQS